MSDINRKMLTDLRLIILAYVYMSNRLSELTGQDAAAIRAHMIKTATEKVQAKNAEDLDRIFENAFRRRSA